MKTIWNLLFSLSLVCGLMAKSVSAAENISVFVSIVPQKYFVEQIGGDMVDVKVMVKPGSSPHNYEPKPQQLTDLAKAKIYFAVGVPFEGSWLDKIASSNPDMLVVHTEENIEKLQMAAHHHHDEEAEGNDEEHHDHDVNEHEEDEHDEHGLDPHIWLSPVLVKIQASSILSALQKTDPEHAAIYESNFKSFIQRVDALDNELKELFKGRKGLQFMVFHPSWGYFADAYGLKQVPVELEGKDPSPKQLQILIHEALEDNIKVVFVQPQFSKRSAEVIAGAIGGSVAVADPLAEQWETNLRDVADKFKAALK